MIEIPTIPFTITLYIILTVLSILGIRRGVDSIWYPIGFIILFFTQTFMFLIVIFGIIPQYVRFV